MNTKTIKFDLNKYKLYEKIKAKQGDTKSRFLLFQLLDGSIPFNLKNRSVRAYMIKPDGREIFNDLIVNNYNLGYCTLELTNQVLAAQGIVKIELMVTEGDKKLTSSVFELEVVKSINSEKSIVSTNEFTALLNGLAALSEYDNYKNSVKEMEINKANKAEVEEKFISVEEKIKNNSEQLETKAKKTEVQMYKLTKDDNGERIYLTESFDLLELEPGYYESSVEPINAPRNTSAFIEIDVMKNTSGSGIRKQIIVNYNYDKRVFIGNIHNGSFRGWEELSFKSSTQGFYEETKNNLYNTLVSRTNKYSKSFVFITDTHYIRNAYGKYGLNGLEHIKNAIDFTNEGIVDLFIHGGDIINGKTAPSTYKQELKECVDEMKKSNYPVAICKGNHDYGLWYNDNATTQSTGNILTQDQWYARMVKPFASNFEHDVNNRTGGYYYKDFKDVKLRVIFLNTADIVIKDGVNVNTHAIGKKQMEWLANEALKFSESGWKVITFSHISFFSSDIKSSTINGYYVSKLLKAMNEGTSYNLTGTTEDYEFSLNGSFTNKAKHLCNIAGHYHRYEYFVNDDGIKFINLLHSACADKESGLTEDESVRELGTVTEDSWNVISLNLYNDKVYIDKFGSGYSNVYEV